MKKVSQETIVDQLESALEANQESFPDLKKKNEKVRTGSILKGTNFNS